MEPVAWWQRFAERISLLRWEAGEAAPYDVALEATALAIEGMARMIAEELVPAVRRFGEAAERAFLEMP